MYGLYQNWLDFYFSIDENAFDCVVLIDEQNAHKIKKKELEEKLIIYNKYKHKLKISFQ